MAWKPIATAPDDGTLIWAIDIHRTIYRVRWYDVEGLFVDEMTDDAGKLTH